MLDHFNFTIWLIPVSTFVAGIVGSPHCLSMCGPIVACFSNRGSHLAAYQAGRFLSYALAGAMAGAMGKTVLGDEQPLWLSGLTLFSVAVLLILHGYRMFAKKPSKSSLHFPVPKVVSNVSMTLWRLLRQPRVPRVAAAGIAGILTVLLPCGHLYTFLVGAVATGSAARGAAFMAAFWLGSTPLLSVSGHWLQKILRPRVEGGHRWAGVLLIFAGLSSVVAFGARTPGYRKAVAEIRSTGPSSARGTDVPMHHCH